MITNQELFNIFGLLAIIAWILYGFSELLNKILIEPLFKNSKRIVGRIKK